MRNYLSVLLCLLLFASCSEERPTYPAVEPDASDVTNGCSHIIIDVDMPKEIRLHTQRNVSLDYTLRTDIDLFVEKKGENQFISWSFKKSHDLLKLPFTVKVAINIEGEESETGLNKDLYISFRRSAPVSPDVSYARAIGKGTKPWGDMGNVTYGVLDFNAIYPNLAISENLQLQHIFVETSGERYSESLENIATNVGLSGTVPVKGLLFSGSAAYGYGKSQTKSGFFEYYMGYYGKRMSEVKLNIDWLINEMDYKCVLDTTVNDVLNNSQSKAYKNYDNTKEGIYALLDRYGTHVITRAVFGGNYITLFAREENAYETTIGHDASAAISGTTQLSSTRRWTDVYVEKTNSTAMGVNASGSNYSQEYNSASKGFYIITARGGNASADMESWDKSMTIDSKETWVPISYITSDASSNEDNGLISIVDFCVEPNRQEALNKYIKEYYNEHTVELEEAPMIVVDFMMKVGTNGHAAGDPESFVAKDPHGIERIYFPMMANSNAPVDNGYALDTSEHEYIVATDHSDHYWYYALGHRDPEAGVYGIVDIAFDNKDKSGYVQRGDHADSDIDGVLDNNYVLLKYASKDTSEDEIITGIGLRRKDNDKIMASTGGTEMVYPWGSDDSRFNKYWGNSNEYTFRDYKWFAGSGLVVNCNFYPVFTTKPLDVDFSFGDQNAKGKISHPRKWGE